MLFSPGTEVVAITAPQADKTEAVAQKTEVAQPEQQATLSNKGPSLAEQIRQERTERAARVAKEAEETSTKAKLDEVTGKLTKFEKGKENILLDSLGYLKELGLSEKEICKVAENAMYALVPDKAPPSWRAEAVEAQYTRDKKLAEERQATEKTEAEKRAQKQAVEAGEQMELQYKEALAEMIPTFTTETHPVSAAWFADDQADYAESLFHTAQNLASEATRAGKRADLSPANVAAVLEKHMAGKATRLQPKQAPSAPVSKPSLPVKLPDKKPETFSKATPMSDEERIARATKAAFPNG